MTIEEAAEKYANDRYEELYKIQNLKEFSDTTRLSDFTDGINEGFIKGAQWQLEQKQTLSDEEINKLAEKYIKFPLKMEVTAFIKGFKAALQRPSSPINK